MTPERIGPRQIIAVSSLSVSRFELTISIAERDIAGTISGLGCCPGGVDGSGSSPSGVVSPNRRGIEVPVMSASRIPTFLPARRRPTAISAVVSDLPTPPLPDMIGTTYVKRARRANSPGARRTGVLSSFMIVGTRPERRACVSAARTGSTRRPCAFAPCSIVSYLLTPQPAQCRPNSVSTSSAIESSATISRMLVRGLISVWAMRRELHPSSEDKREYRHTGSGAARGVPSRLVATRRYDTSDGTMVDTLIVGGGPAGLAAARYLADAGRSAVVLEKRPILGGKLSSWRDRDGDILETGLHAFFGGFTALHALLKEVGIAHHVLWQPHTLTWAMPPGFSPRWNGAPVYEEFRFVDAPSPFNGIGAVLNARYVFNHWENVQFAKGSLPVLLGDHAYASAQDDLTYAEWHRRRGMSEHMLRTFFAPMALALNFTSVDQISAEAMLRVMAYFASSPDASRAGLLDGPPGPRFVEPLAEHVRARSAMIATNAAVGELLFSGDRSTGARTRDGRRFEAENVILATPVHDAKKLLPAAMQRDPSIAGVAKLESSPRPRST